MKKVFVLQLPLAAALFGQGGLDPRDIMKPLSDQWTSYSGDLSGKRYSSLKFVNKDTVRNLSLQWVSSGITTGCGPNGTGPADAAAGGGGVGGGGGFGGGFGGFGGGGRGGRGGGGGPAARIIVGGLGTGDANNCNPVRFGGGILFIDAIIYATAPDNVYAIDACD